MTMMLHVNRAKRKRGRSSSSRRVIFVDKEREAHAIESTDYSRQLEHKTGPQSGGNAWEAGNCFKSAAFVFPCISEGFSQSQGRILVLGADQLMQSVHFEPSALLMPEFATFLGIMPN